MPSYDPVTKVRAKQLAKRLSGPPAKGDPFPARKGANVEDDDSAEIDAVRAALKTADKNVADVSSEGFHCTLVFLTESQRDAFLAAAGWTGIEGGRYIDGIQVAEAMGIDLPAVRPTGIRPGATDRKAIEAGIIPD